MVKNQTFINKHSETLIVNQRPHLYVYVFIIVLFICIYNMLYKIIMYIIVRQVCVYLF